MSSATISVVIPSYRREGVLVETVRQVLAQLGARDEIVIVDQTPEHELVTEKAIAELRVTERVRWYRKRRPSICEAMNVGALLARNDIVLFLDDDVVPVAELLEIYREVFGGESSPHAVNGQVLQPWNEQPVKQVADYELGFDFAYSRRAEVVPALTANFAVTRRVFLESGGMDETFEGGAHRCDADLGYRLRAFTGKPARFEPAASVRHLQAGGGTRAHGAKDSWASIGSAVGDHYFGLQWFAWYDAIRHSSWRTARACVNRGTLLRPWLVPVLLVREIVAFSRALRLSRRAPRLVRALRDYEDLGPSILTCESGTGARG